MLGRVVALGEEAGGLDDHLSAQRLPGQLGGVGLVEDLDAPAVDDERIAVGLHRPGPGTVH